MADFRSVYSELDELKRENARLKQIISYYADQSNWKIETRDTLEGIVAEFNPDDIYYEDEKWMGGKKAQNALR
jgi:hypothetical protein